MVRPSNPRLMARVLDAVANLGDTRGSSAREVLSLIRHSNVSSKNLTLQVHRALKHAVNAGLLRHRSGRYKALATLNPNSVPSKEPPANKESANNQINEQKKSKPDVQASISDIESSRVQERKKKTTRQRNSRHRNTEVRRKSRRSPYRRPNAAQNRKRQRKCIYEDDEKFDHSSGQDFLYRRDDSPVLFNRKTKRSRVSKRELESDFSDESECDSDVSQKRVFRAKKSFHREPKRKARAKSKDKSASRARSPQLLQRAVQARQHSTEETENDRQRCDENHGSAEHNVICQEVHKDIERVHEPNNSNSGSTLENSRD
ncbi:uncharacterized protein [Mycetomoellerius zeteki]|uniref:uncharacterized protein isoform X2 n=1 Tax=Mycetomoellerius zeteki TaxID=64791 RepID=UPI00084EBA0D|nr:PREDICTED: uncharacterized protein LOC108728360 isoform X2 [Trachymyrmex zeteki]